MDTRPAAPQDRLTVPGQTNDTEETIKVIEVDWKGFDILQNPEMTRKTLGDEPSTESFVELAEEATGPLSIFGVTRSLDEAERRIAPGDLLRLMSVVELGPEYGDKDDDVSTRTRFRRRMQGTTRRYGKLDTFVGASDSEVYVASLHPEKDALASAVRANTKSWVLQWACRAGGDTASEPSEQPDPSRLYDSWRALYKFYRSRPPGAVTYPAVAGPPTLLSPATAPDCCAWWTDNESAQITLLAKSLGVPSPGHVAIIDLLSYDLLNLIGLETYVSALFEGPSSALFVDYVYRKKLKSDISRIVKAQELKREGMRIRAGQYVIIAADKLGVRLPDAVARSPDPRAILKALNPKDRKLVELEYKAQEKYRETERNNKCPHVKLARQLRGPTVTQQGSALRSLRTYFDTSGEPTGKATVHRSTRGSHTPKGSGVKARQTQEDEAGLEDENTWIMCRNCGLRIVCPHVVKRVTLEQRKAPHTEIVAALARFAISRAVGTGSPGERWCKICAEYIGEVHDSAEETKANVRENGDLNAEDRNRMWQIAFASVRALRFATPTDERRFAASVTDVAYPLFVLAGDKAKGRRLYIQKAAISAQLDMVMYVYAVCLDLALRSRPGEIAVSGVRSTRATDMAKGLLDHITREHASIINQLTDVTPEALLSRFTAAYGDVRGAAGGLTLVAPNGENELARQLAVDAVYHYALAVAKLAGDLPLPDARTPDEAAREFKVVMGASVSEIVKRARLAAKKPEVADLYLRRLGKAATDKLEYLTSGPDVAFHRDLYEPSGGSAKIDRREARRIAGGGPHRTTAPRTRGRWRPPMPDAATAHIDRQLYFDAYSLLATYVKRIVSDKAYTEYRKAFEKQEQAERARYTPSAVPRHAYEHVDKRIRIVDDPLLYALVWDEEGRKHVWGRGAIYIYRRPAADPKTPPAELRIPQGAILKKRAEGEAIGDLVDIECPVCGIWRSKIGDLDVDKIKINLAEAYKKESFFLFYEVRCPVKGLHEWGKDPSPQVANANPGLPGLPPRSGAPPRASTVCVKCGKRYGEKQAAYYDKYRDAFIAARKAVATVSAPPPVAEPTPPRPVEWKPEYTYVVKAAEIAGVSTATIEAIGSTENRDYGEVTEGSNLPPPPTSPDDPRIRAANSAVHMFLFDYATIRNAARRGRLPPWLTTQVPKPDYPILASLPDIRKNYTTAYSQLLLVLPPPDMLRFVVQSLCEMVVAIDGYSPPEAAHPWMTPLVKEFAKKSISRILKTESLLAKPGAFNWAVFELTQELVPPPELGDEEMLEPAVNGDPLDADIDYDLTEANPNNEPS